mgnify:CR=1 FL=1
MIRRTSNRWSRTFPGRNQVRGGGSLAGGRRERQRPGRSWGWHSARAMQWILALEGRPPGAMVAGPVPFPKATPVAATASPLRTSPGAASGGVDVGRLLLLPGLAAAGLWLWDVPWLAPCGSWWCWCTRPGTRWPPWLFGGRVERVVVGADESGQCLAAHSHRAGWRRCAVYSAGYVGSAVSGALQLILAFRFRLHRAVLCAHGRRGSPAMGLVYAGNAFTLAYCLGVPARCCSVLSWLLPAGAVRALVMVLAALHRALRALRPARRPVAQRRPGRPSDAALLAAQTHVPRPRRGPSSGPRSSVAVLALRRRRCRCGGRRGNPQSPDALQAVRSLAASGAPRTTPRSLNWK